MEEWVKIFDDRIEATNRMNQALSEGYELIDFKMCGAGTGGYYGGVEHFRYFVHMRREMETQE